MVFVCFFSFKPGCSNRSTCGRYGSPTHGESDSLNLSWGSCSLPDSEPLPGVTTASLASLNHLQFPQWVTSSHSHSSLPECFTSSPGSLMSDSAELCSPGRQLSLVLAVFLCATRLLSSILDLSHCLFTCHFPH